MNAHQSNTAKFEECQSRSHFEWDDNVWEHEGKYMELEKLLREGDGQHFSKQRKLEQSRDEDAEREPYYERVEGNGLQHENRGGAFQDAREKTRGHADSQMENTQGRATDWQDFGDYEPGYSGHQISHQRRGGVLSGSDSKGESGSRTLRGRSAKKAAKRKQEPRTKPLRGRAAKSNRPSRRRR